MRTFIHARSVVLLLSLTSFAPVANADTATLTFGSIPPGQSSTVTVRATVGGTPSSISNQATVSGTGITSVLSDDPGVGGAADATILPVDPPCPAVSLQGLGNGQLGVVYSGAAAASGGVGPYTYAVSSGALPPGLSLTFSGASAGSLAGTPSSTGTFTFRVTAIDTGSAGTCTGRRDYSLIIGSVVAAGDLVVREFRTRGPAGPEDEFVEISNRSAGNVTILAPDGSAGFGIASESLGLLATIPNGTVIPVGGFYLAANSTPTTGYSLYAYGGAGEAAPDRTWTANLPDHTGVGLFRSSSTFDSTTRLDAVGFVGSAATFIEGTGLAISGPTGASEVAYARIAPGGVAQDTGSNAADFYLADTNAATFGAVTARLGAPGPQNLSSERAAGLVWALADPTKGSTTFPNRWRVSITGTTGTYFFRWKITNNTGAAITSLRVRTSTVTTLNSPGYVLGGTQADFRLATSPDSPPITVPVDGTVVAAGLTLEAPATGLPLQGGYNSSAVVTLPGGTLAAGASVYINVALYYAQAGSYAFYVVGEAK